MSENQNWGSYDSPLAAAVFERDRETINMVRQGLRKRNVLLAFQPIFSSQNTDHPSFFEGLVRVRDGTKRVIPATDFIYEIEPFEEGRLIDCLSLEMGCQALIDNPDLRLSINISPRTIGLEQWDAVFDRAVHMDPTLAERLIIEITEASAMTMPDVVCNFMDRLHSKGVSFALDDFGAGYTAFRHFKDFYFDLVKIDSQFIKDVHEDRDNQVLTAALTSIARHFDMHVVAEGVEKPQEAEYLIGAEVDCLQGYLFGAPQLRLPERLGKGFRAAG
ncbi:MAG: EAL domain-containing protein [Litoreibacter sp.]|nr:EAL domain-containing protein [Litoreibacter sp.]